MELKVWCDGIQRVVCGVTQSTTCQDVVFALAHATGQTGRFILIEKFRNNERLLSPTEQPLTVLSKWGEYGNDVSFVMKRSDLHNKSQNNSCLASNCTQQDCTHTKTNDKKNIFSSASSSSSTNKSLTSNSSPQKSSTNTSPLKSNSCLNSSQKTDTINSTPSKTQLNNNNISNNTNNNNTNFSPSKSRPKHPPPYCEAISKSALISNNNSFDNNSNLNSSQECFDDKNNKRRSLEPSPQTNKQRTNNSQKDISLQRDAIRLVDMQLKTIKKQEKDMSSLEQQITTIETKLKENENVIEKYKTELDSIQQLWLDQEIIIEKLDQQKLEQEFDELVNSQHTYEEELLVMKKKLSQCEGDIGDCRQRIAKLMDKLDENQKCVKLNDFERDDNDRQMLDQLKTAIRDKTMDLESKKCELQTLTNQITHLDNVLHEKSLTVEKLTNDLKDANIQALTLQTSDELLSFSKIPFHQRSGSTRRIIGSPRELGNAVATNKNPNGVWV